MAEFRNPDQENSKSQSVLVFIFALACVFFGLRQFHATNGQATALHQTQKFKVAAVKEADPDSSGSMNAFERKLFVPLAFIHAHVVAKWSGSWGWAIVLLTTAINLLLLPLRTVSLRSGVKMQRIQPQIQVIKARYKNFKIADPRRNDMAAEISKLQQDNGAHPAGGCLPLLIQMPLLLAFFGMLRKAVALRGAEWLWIHDLSSADPYHVLPILMIVFQMLAQLYTPSPGGDARQQKVIACVMAIGFGYVSWHYASGLALYALTGSMLSIAAQAGINCSALGREMKALRA